MGMQTNIVKCLKRSNRLFISLLTWLAVLSILTGIGWPNLILTRAADNRSSTVSTEGLLITHLPVVLNKFPYRTSFGVESFATFDSSQFLNHATNLQLGYVRLNDRISWRELQTNDTAPINWDLLVQFEAELRALRSANISPIIVVDDYPVWATDNTVRLDEQTTSCGPLLTSRYDDFARFMRALVLRYSVPEFNVSIWELGNEPDVDPNQVPPNNHYGCWGDWDELYFNGDAYGEMLKVVTPVIRAADPTAQVWIGGLLLDSPTALIPNHIGKPQLFFQGILEAGAAPYFDVVPYHAYIHWRNEIADADIFSLTDWDVWGGMLVGKANFLRTIMRDYGVSKPLFVTETSVVCTWCDDTREAAIFDMQASMVARFFPRALAARINGVAWYTLDGPGWAYGGLLDDGQVIKPVYNAYNTFMDLTAHADFFGAVALGSGIEAYAYLNGSQRIDIAFTITDTTATLTIPQSQFIAAYDRFGQPIYPLLTGEDYAVTVQFEPIYLVRVR